MISTFLEALPTAQGRSEFVIVVVADVRGFSDFSRRNESPNIAMYIKRLYLQMVKKYFPSATFVKPTGDGLLMTFPYSETNLLEVAKNVLESCFRCLSDFPSICAGDPMINFDVPKAIGFGVARGTACCLYAADQTLDYSGHLLNLASRLMDLARPSGIVVDGNFLKEVIPDTYRDSFKEQKVFLRSIAEDTPMTVLYLADYVHIPDSALNPLRGENWQTLIQEFTMRRLLKLGQRFQVRLAALPISKDKLKVTLQYPVKGMKGIKRFRGFDAYELLESGPEHLIILDLDKLREVLAPDKPGPNTKITLKIDYVPLPLPRT